MGISIRRLAYAGPFGILVSCALMLLPGATPSAVASGCRYANAHPKSISLQHAEQSVLCLTNRERAARGLPRLSARASLAIGADRHSRAMEQTHRFTHQCPGEAGLETRLWSTGYFVQGMLRWAYGENIAWGLRAQSSPREIVNAWMHSPEHRVNMLNPTFRDAGVGILWGTPNHSKARGATYTMDFGYRLVG